MEKLCYETLEKQGYVRLLKSSNDMPPAAWRAASIAASSRSERGLFASGSTIVAPCSRGQKKRFPFFGHRCVS